MNQLAEILKKVRRIEIKSKGLSQNVFSGSYNTKFKGHGISFSEIREYIPGDDVRMIDWKVSAKMQKTYVKVFHEERELTMMLMIDVSPNMLFGAHYEAKRDYMAEIVGILSMSAITNNDKVGVILYADKVIKYIPPSRGKSHILRIIQETLMAPRAVGIKSNLNAAIDFFTKMHKRKTICFLMSSFQHDVQDIKVRILSQKHDLIALHIYDKLERNMPDVGWVRIKNLSNNEERLINTSDVQLRQRNVQLFDDNAREKKELFLRQNASWLSMDTSVDQVKILQKFFLNRK